MVGRNAVQKDWPAFHAVADLVKEKVGDLNVWNLGEVAFCPDAKERIAQMDLFVMTSKFEEMPTTVLECFRAKTPICGFIPKGGMAEILAFSNGALREVFIAERDIGKLAAIAVRLLGDAALRARVVEDGWQILTRHFNAEKNVKGRLMEVYGEMGVEGWGLRVES